MHKGRKKVEEKDEPGRSIPVKPKRGLFGFGKNFKCLPSGTQPKDHSESSVDSSDLKESSRGGVSDLATPAPSTVGDAEIEIHQSSFGNKAKRGHDLSTEPATVRAESHSEQLPAISTFERVSSAGRRQTVTDMFEVQGGAPMVSHGSAVVWYLPVLQRNGISRSLTERKVDGVSQSARKGKQQVEEEDDEDLVDVEIEDLRDGLEHGNNTRVREVLSLLRNAVKKNQNNRKNLVGAGILGPLVNHLGSPDAVVIEDALVSLRNICLSTKLQVDVMEAGVVGPLVHILKEGFQPAIEDAVATLYSLAFFSNSNKRQIAKAGALPLLVTLLHAGSTKCRKSAAQTIFCLSLLADLATEACVLGAVGALLKLLEDVEVGAEEQAVAAISVLAKVNVGVTKLGEEKESIPILVEVIEGGSSRAKEDAAAALLLLCLSSSRFLQLVLREGIIPSLVALARSGRPRARDKANKLMQLIRNHSSSTCQPASDISFNDPDADEADESPASVSNFDSAVIS